MNPDALHYTLYVGRPNLSGAIFNHKYEVPCLGIIEDKE